MVEVIEVKQRIQKLIDKATADNERQKKVLRFLFDKLGEVKELEMIDRLRKFSGGSEYLRGYLLYKSIARSNFQIELTKHANFEDDRETGLGGQDKLLEAIFSDIEQWEKDNQDKIPISEKQLTNEELLIILGKKLATNEIKRELSNFGSFLIFEGKKGMVKVDLYDGKVTPNPADEFLKKHGFDKP